MRIDIHYPGVETHRELIESEIRELSALQQELEPQLEVPPMEFQLALQE